MVIRSEAGLYKWFINWILAFARMESKVTTHLTEVSDNFGEAADTRAIRNFRIIVGAVKQDG
jgi:hypothetical protein